MRLETGGWRREVCNKPLRQPAESWHTASQEIGRLGQEEGVEAYWEEAGGGELAE